MIGTLRQAWRPVTCLAVAGVIAANGIYLPVVTQKAADFAGIALLLGALAPFGIARSLEVIKGRSRDAEG